MPRRRFSFGWMRPASSSSWSVVQAYSTSNQLHWTATTGSHYVSIWVKDAASSTLTFDANAAVAFQAT
jgi:hypothetical protein